MWTSYVNATSLEQALDALASGAPRARIVAGGTDLIIEIETGVRKGIDTLVDITRIPGLCEIALDEDDRIHLGPLVTHNHCVASKLIRDRALPLALAAWEVGAPQIRNRGTVAGNLITASPANDTLTPLMALDASVTLRSLNGQRDVPLREFFTGVRKNVMQPDEMLVDIHFPALDVHTQRGTFYKLGLRRAQAISLVHIAAILSFDGKKVSNAAITLGSVAPTIIHAAEAEAYLVGRSLDEETISRAAELVAQAAAPIDDIRSSAAYRKHMLAVCAARVLRSLAGNVQGNVLPKNPVLLWGDEYECGVLPAAEILGPLEGAIQTTINGKPYTLPGGHNKTLLRLLREDALLIGTKEGCMEGECGACTVFLDGAAVMSCLVPAPRAHGAHIVTVEGLAQNGALHPVQQAFIDSGAVQCGYCTPGFIMSAAKLLEERPRPTKEEAKQAITGNLCRCTGYYKIVDAIQQASLAR